MVMTLRFTLLSSATRIFNPEAGVGSDGGRVSADRACEWVIGRIKRKVEPFPGVESIVMLPPIIWTILWEILRPNPVPPCCRLGVLSSWVKLAKSFCWFSGVMPTPVSLTENSMEFPAPRSEMSRATRPLSVNLIAFVSRLMSTCLSRVPSPSMEAGNAGSITNSRWMGFFSAKHETMLIDSCAH